MKHNFFFFLALCAGLLSFSSCSDDDETPNDPVGPQSDPKTIVLSYDKFLNENDVQIISADTTKISVNKKYLEANRIDTKVSNDTLPMVVWRTMDTEPFVRNVIKSEDMGDVVELTTVRGDMGDVFPDAELNLETDVYVDPSKPKMMTRVSGITSVNPARYIDKEGTYHPAVFIVDNNVEELDENGNPITKGTRTEGKKCFTADELMAQNADFRILDINHRFDDKDFTLLKEGDLKVKFYAKDMNVKAVSGLRIKVKTRWFKLKYFECVAYGDFGAGATLGFQATAKKEIKFNKDLARFGSCSAVFWVGVIPVAVNVSSGLKTEGSMNLSAKCDISTTLDCYANFETGATWSGGWNKVANASAGSKHGLNLATDMQLKANADAAALIYANVSLYGCGGPGIELGPKAMAEGSAEAKTETTQEGSKVKLSANYEVGVDVIGKVTADLHIWKWRLAYWEYPFNVWKGPRYSGEWTKVLN